MNGSGHRLYSSPVGSQATRSLSSWRKGCLFGLILMTGLVLALDAIGQDGCTIDGIGAMNYLSLNIGGFSIFIQWNGATCR